MMADDAPFQPEPSTESSNWPNGPGEMACCVRTRDWAATPLGPSENWPERLKVAIELVLASPLVASIAIGQQRLFMYNDASAVLYGDRHPDILGLPLAKAFPDTYLSVSAYYDRVFAGESLVVKAQPLAVGTGGEQHMFDAYLTPLSDAGGGIIAAYMVGFEISEQKRVQAALRDSEARYRAFVTASADVVYRMNPDWTEMCELTGHGFLVDTHQPRHDWRDQYILPESHEVENAIEHAIATKTMLDLEHMVIRADGTTGWSHSRAVPICDSDGAVTEWVGTASDITERKRTTEILRQSEERHSFLLELGDALRPLADAQEIECTAVRMLGEKLGADRAFYGLIDIDSGTGTVRQEYAPHGPTMVGRHILTDYQRHRLAEWQAGRVTMTTDSETDPEFSDADKAAYASVGTRAAVGVPLIKDGKLVALLAINQFSPRNWSPDELDLITQVAERTWATVERARAETSLREREAELALTQYIGEVASLDIDLVHPFTGHRSPEYCRLHGIPSSVTVERHEDWVSRLHPDDRERAHRVFTKAVENGNPYECEYRIIRPSDGELRWISAKGMIAQDAEGKATRMLGAHIDITDRKLLDAALTESETRLQSLVGGMPQLVWRACDGGEWTWASPQWTDYTGQSEADSHRLGWLGPVHPDDRAQAVEIWEHAEQVGLYQADYRIFHYSEQRYRWFQTRASPLRDEAENITEWLGTSTDVDDLRAMQDRQQILVAELQHRTRNLLSVVNATMSSTMRDSANYADFATVFRHRLQALSRVNALLSRRIEGDRISFDELIEMELAGIGVLDANGMNPRIQLDGPKGVALRSTTVQTFALAIHELATNALKYGALRQTRGNLSILWEIHHENTGRRLHLIWHETGVAMPEKGAVPQGGGYGRELIERALPYQLQADTYYEVRDDGICCTIDMPIPESDD